MKIQIRTFAMLREIIGSKEVEFEAKDPIISSILDDLLQEYPSLADHILKNEELNPSYIIAVNGENIDHDRLSSFKLDEGDQLAILPPAGGG